MGKGFWEEGLGFERSREILKVMAKTGIVEGGGGGDQLGGKVMELKKELQRLVKAIVVDDCDDINLESLDWAHQILSSLKEFKIKRSLSLKLHESVFVPEPFRCPLSKELMRDPVIIATGQVRALSFILSSVFYKFLAFKIMSGSFGDLFIYFLGGCFWNAIGLEVSGR